jgi:translation initiation factor IF-2
LEDLEKAMKGMLAPTYREVLLGTAEVRATFKAKSIGTIAGCYITDGIIKRNAKARLVRNGVVIYDGEISSLKRFKEDVKEVQKGFECGLTLKNFNDIKVGDIIEAYEIVEERPQ